MATQHVVSRSVRDCAGILDCTAGPVSGDPHIAPLPGRLFLAEVTTDPGVLRVGFTVEGKGMPFEEESSGLVDSRDWVAMVTCPAYFGDRSFQEMKVPATALDTF